MKSLTCVVLKALAGIASLSAAAHAMRSTRFRVAQVDLSLAVVPREAGGTAAAQPSDGVDGSEQDGIGCNKGRQAVKLQHRHTLHVVLTRLAQADVVIKGKNLLGGNLSEKTAVQIQSLLELLRAEKLPRLSPSPRPVASVTEPTRTLVSLPKHGHSHRQADVEDASADVCVILDVEDHNVFRGSGQDPGHAVQELRQQQGQEMFLGGVGQSQRDAVGQHFICDDGDLENALS